jgi:thioredoxin-dependent peroxiredoxin
MLIESVYFLPPPGTLTVETDDHGIKDKEKPVMALQLGDEAPDFTAETTEGTINFHEWLGDSWGVLFSHPKDFTPVCTTELGSVARLKGEFDRRNAKVIAVSVDPIGSHRGWIPDINETQATTVNFPIIADPDRKVADLYGMIHPNAADTVTVRSVFIVGPDKKVKLTITYPQSTGRNFQEILRVIDSLQLTAKYSVSTPADWQDGDDVIIVPAVSDEDAKERFPKGWTAARPYLRLTPQPNK